MRPQPLSLAVLILSSYSVCAIAEPIEYATVVGQSDVREKMVNYGDLNLQRHEGVSVLYARIKRAANLVCFEVNQRVPHVAIRAQQCASEAVTRAVAQVGVPALAALHAQETAKEPTTLVAGPTR